MFLKDFLKNIGRVSEIRWDEACIESSHYGTRGTASNIENTIPDN